MAVTERVVSAPPEKVFAILSDGWTYSDWVVGTTHIRDVDPDFPAVGSRIHHKAGPWPMSLHDETVVLRCEPPRRLVLRPKLRPLGEMTVAITLTPDGAGKTRVTLREDTSGGPLLWVRTKINDLLLHGRNREALRRLADIAEKRGERHESPGLARQA